MAESSSWRKQYERMIRWRHRFWLDLSVNEDDATDIFFSFAQACAHLVDWLENDKSQPVRRSVAEAHVAASTALVFCVRVCNGSKHAQLKSKGVYTAPRPMVNSFQIPGEDGGTQEIVSTRTRLSVDWNGSAIDTEEFAKVCVEEWKRFLRDKGLLDQKAVVSVVIDGAGYSTIRSMTSSLPSSDIRRAVSTTVSRNMTGGPIYRGFSASDPHRAASRNTAIHAARRVL